MTSDGGEPGLLNKSALQVINDSTYGVAIGKHQSRFSTDNELAVTTNSGITWKMLKDTGLCWTPMVTS